MATSILTILKGRGDGHLHSHYSPLGGWGYGHLHSYYSSLEGREMITSILLIFVSRGGGTAAPLPKFIEKTEI